MALILAACGASTQQTQIVESPLFDAKVHHLVDSLYNHMTDAERVAQLQGVRPSELMVDGKVSRELCREVIPNGIGHISQMACMLALTPNELRDMVRDIQNYLIEETPTGIPAICHEEAITGFAGRGATTYPQQLGMSCTWNEELMELKTRYTGESMREVGAFMALSPNVDIIRTSVFNRGEEALGEDPYLTTRLGVAFVEGLQGDDLSNGVAACAKHYLGYGGGSDYSTQKELYEEILMPYDALLRVAGCKNVMTAYHKINDEYCVFNKYIIEDILRDYLEYDGLVISDYGAIGQIGQKPKKSEQDLAERAAKALNAGCELELSKGDAFPFIPQALEQGLLSEERFAHAVKMNLALKVRLGMMDRSRPLYKDGNIDMDKPKYRQLAYDAAGQSVVLLKNNGVLPLSAESGKVGLAGPNANSGWAMMGDYTYQSMFLFHRAQAVGFDSPKVYTLKESMMSRLKGATLDFERGCHWSMDNESFLNIKENYDPRFMRQKVFNVHNHLFATLEDETNWDAALAMAKRNDVVVVGVGENLALCGEGRGRKGIGLPGEQERLVEELIATGTPVVVVAFGGRAMVLSDYIIENAAAIVQAWYPGQEGGNAVADILFGNLNPSGKLTMTYANRHDVVDLCYNKADEQVAKALYPFGYGLSYTTYAYSDIESPREVKVNGAPFEVSFTLANSGDRAGDEVVQLYISPVGESTTHKPIQLKGFDRVSLKAGESKRVTFSLSPQLLAYYTGENWQTSAGEFVVKIGASSADIRLEAPLRLSGQSITTRNRDYFFSQSI